MATLLIQEAKEAQELSSMRVYARFVNTIAPKVLSMNVRILRI